MGKGGGGAWPPKLFKIQSNSTTITKDYHELPVNTLLGTLGLITLLLKFIWTSNLLKYHNWFLKNDTDNSYLIRKKNLLRFQASTRRLVLAAPSISVISLSYLSLSLFLCLSLTCSSKLHKTLKQDRFRHKISVF